MRGRDPSLTQSSSRADPTGSEGRGKVRASKVNMPEAVGSGSESGEGSYGKLGVGWGYIGLVRVR